MNFHQDQQSQEQYGEMYQLNNSGTYDLAGSFKQPKVSHIQTFGGDDLYSGLQNNANEQTLGQSTGKMNLSNGFREEMTSNDLRISASLDPFNLSSSGRLPLHSGIASESKKYAQMDHFKHDENLQQNLNKSIEEKERKNIQALIQQEKQRDEDAKEQQVLERLVAGTKQQYQDEVQRSKTPSPQKQLENAAAAPVTRATESIQTDTEDHNPKFPQFEDQLKEIRESFAKQYEDKMKRGFQELADLKKDIAMKQETFDSKQVRDLRREIKRLEDEVLENQNAQIELRRSNENLKFIIKEKDIALTQVNSGAQVKDGFVGALKDQIKERDLQIEAMLAKMDIFKKSLDEINFKYLESQTLLDQMKSQDFARQNLILKRQTAELTDSLSLKQSYLDDLKQNMKLAMQSISSSNDHKQQSAIFSNLLENLSQENVKGRRLIDELQKRENICQRKWNKLLQENLDLQDKINGHNLQLQRTREQYQLIVQQNERKLLEANQRLAWLQNQEDKRAAAEYLVDQMRIVNEEKQTLVFDNQNLQQQQSQMIYEYSRLERDMKDFLCFRTGADFSDYNMNQDPVAQNIARLTQRVEELEDLVVELKSKQSASEVVELKQLVSQLELENLAQIKQLKGMQQKRLSGKDLFMQNEMHSSYLSIMKEREKIIEQLHQQLKKFSDQRVMNPQNIHSFGGSGAASIHGRSEESNAKARHESKNSGSNFEEEKMKDAVNFKNLMQTMQQSNGFAGMHGGYSQDIPRTIEVSRNAPFNSEVVTRGRSEYESNQMISKEHVFPNFSKHEKDEWLLNSSQENIQM